MMRNGEWSEKKDILCVNPPKWKEEKKQVKTTTHTHITRGEKKTIQKPSD